MVGSARARRRCCCAISSGSGDRRGSRAGAVIGLAIAAAALPLRPAPSAESGTRPLVLERTIPIADVAGRIDHLAIDLARKRVLVAELGNGSVDFIDLGSGSVVRRLSGLQEPQGIAYLPGPDLVVVASGGDGTVRLFKAADGAPDGTIPLGEDADNVRLDPLGGHAFVGYGEGELAVVDVARRAKIGEIKLAAHPEGFQLDAARKRVYVNVPDAGEIAVVDLVAQKQVARWTVPKLRANFPMALDAGRALLAVVYRRPARLVLLDAGSGATKASLDSCGDADDVFFDARRRRIYVSCGEGAVQVFEEGGGLRSIARIETSAGARTSLFVPELDRLFVATRAVPPETGAALLVFRPQP